MTFFLIIGILGIVLIVVSLIVGEVLGDLFSDFDGGGVLSTPVIGSFLAAFGFGAALIDYATDLHKGTVALGGLLSGLFIGGIALLLTRSIMNMPTDEPIKSANMVGLQGTVITAIPQDGFGEVSVPFHGQIMKVSARATSPLRNGTLVRVTAVMSPTSVVVKATESEK